MKRFFMLLSLAVLMSSPAFAVQTGGAGSNNPDIIKGADIQQNMLTVEGTAKSQTIEVTTGITKIGVPTYSWPSALGSANTYLKHGSSGNLTWEGVPGASAAGSTGQIQFNTSNSFDASANLFWNNSLQYLGIGTTEPLSAITIWKDDDNPAAIGLVQSSNSQYRSPALLATRSRGDKTTPTAPQTGDYLGVIGMGGFPMISNMLAAGMVAEATENWSDSTRGAALSLKTTPNGTASSNTVIRLDQDGSVQIESLPPSKYVKTDASSKLTAEALTITTSEIADGSITTSKLADDIAITTTGSISAASFAGNGSGLTNVLPSGNAGGDLTGTYPNPTIGNNKVVAAYLATDSVTSGAIAANAVTTSEIANGSITGNKLASNIAITTTGSISAASLAGSHYGSGSGLTNVSATTAETAGSAGYATTAGSATSATTATTAETAGSAGYATTAGSATSATSATTAETAGSAGYATTAGSATSATTAETAGSAGYATTAGSATSATTAETAGSAGYATTAGSATSATTAETAGSAGYATTAGSATSATTAETAGSAGYATTAGSATSATSATTAETAGSAGYATTAGSATSATTATTAETAGSATPSGSAGGDLTGTYPNPNIGNNKVVAAYLATDSVTSGAIAANAVTTDEIANGSITTDKFASNFTLPVASGGTGANVYPTGEVLFGNGISSIESSSSLIWFDSEKKFEIYNEGLAAQPKLTLYQVDTDGGGDNLPLFRTSRSRGSLSGPTNTQNGDFLGGFVMEGRADSDSSTSAGILAVASENWTDSATGTDLYLISTAQGETMNNPFEKSIKLSGGVVTIPTLPPSLYVKTTASQALTAEALTITAGDIADGSITTSKLAGDISITTTGSISAASFAGNGSGLTNVSATSATTAETAGSAGYATTAGSATSATTATTAETAGSAGYATTAGSATSATSATTAETAGSAGYATTAGSATSATTAETAGSAGYATTAGSATSATTAETAGSAGYATTAGSATSATTATTAETAGSAGYATTAGSATSATTAETAGSATPSGSAGGDLTGTYPNPTIGNNKVVAAYLATDSVTSGAIAANAVTTDEIANGSITGPKLADQITKIGTDNSSAYNITLSNEGTGGVTFPEFGLPMTGAYTLRNTAGFGAISQIGPESSSFPGAAAIFGVPGLLLLSPTLYLIGNESLALSSPNVSISMDTPGGIFKVQSDDGGDPGVITDLVTVNDTGVITAYSLPPSLYVKTTASQALTAEAIDLSSGMAGTLGIQYGGTGTAEYPGSGEILVGDGLDNYSLRIISGDVSMNHLGSVAIRDGVITADKIAANFILPLSKGGTGANTYNYYGVVYPGPGGLMSTLAGPSGTVLKGTGMMPMFGQVVTAEIAAAAVTTETIADNSVTGPKLADQIVKSGTLNGASYNITLSNEGTGDSGLFPLPVSNGFLMNSSGHWGGLFQLSSASPIPGAIAVFSDYFSVLGSAQTTKVTGTDIQLSIDTAGGQLSILSEAGDDPIALLTVNENGVTTISSLPPSLYVKTTASQALTAEAIDLSSGMTGTLQVAQGGTSVGSFTQHGVLYATTATSLDATSAGASGTVLKGTGAAPEFGQVTTLEVANGAITGPKLASNINITTSGNISATSLEVSGKTVYTPSGTNTIVAGDGITASMIAKKAILIAGDGAGTTDISANPQIAAGQNGQEIVLIGTRDTNLVKLDNGNGLQLSAATSFTLGAGDIMQLIYVDSIGKWVEISRTDN